jgi:hypothetical protein
MDIVAQAIGLPAVWPSASETAMGELAEQQGRLKAIYNAHGDSLKRDLGQQSQYLVGKAGDADRQSLTAQMRYAYAAADHFESKVTTALGFQSVLVDIKSSLSDT